MLRFKFCSISLARFQCLIFFSIKKEENSSQKEFFMKGNVFKFQIFQKCAQCFTWAIRKNQEFDHENKIFKNEFRNSRLI